jgi:hypothetical protein
MLGDIASAVNRQFVDVGGGGSCMLLENESAFKLCK